jgi:hypothetical protein
MEDFLEELQRIVQKDDLKESEIEFLKARRSYLTPEQAEKFKEVLGEENKTKSKKSK